MPITEIVFYYYAVTCDGCNDSHGHTEEDQPAVEEKALGDGWMIWEDATKEPGDCESILLILCPACAAISEKDTP